MTLNVLRTCALRFAIYGSDITGLPYKGITASWSMTPQQYRQNVVFAMNYNSSMWLCSHEEQCLRADLYFCILIITLLLGVYINMLKGCYSKFNGISSCSDSYRLMFNPLHCLVLCSVLKLRVSKTLKKSYREPNWTLLLQCLICVCTISMQIENNCFDKIFGSVQPDSCL